MTLPRILRLPVHLADRWRPAFFSEREWRFHLLLFPLNATIGAYLIMGWRYFRDPLTFVSGTLVNVTIYWGTIVVFTLAVRAVIRQFPDVRQSMPRLITMLLVIGSIMTLSAVVDLWLFSVAPGTGVLFSWERVKTLWLLGSVLSPIFCLSLGIFYTYSQWHKNQSENEQLKREALQQQYDALKGQVNPHFLFNSLSSLSALIGEDTALAERFVDDLAKVYRYMLQAGNHELVTVQAELEFMRSYARLLGVRYGDSIRIDVPVATARQDDRLPPLSLQTLVDNALKHNAMLPNRPLVVSLEIGPGRAVRATNTLQRKTRLVNTTRSGLANLVATYRLLSAEPVQIEETEANFRVTLPLLPPAGASEMMRPG